MPIADLVGHLRLLDERPSWRRSELPQSITLDVLRELDSYRLIQIRLYRRFPRLRPEERYSTPQPDTEYGRGGWWVVSEHALRAGRLEEILKHPDHQGDCEPEFRVSPKGADWLRDAGRPGGAVSTRTALADEASVRIWREIAAVTRDLVKFPKSRAYLVALAAGSQPREHPAELLTRLRAIFAEHGNRIIADLPEELRGVDWDELCNPARTDPMLTKVRSYHFEQLSEIAAYMVERHRAKALGEPTAPAVAVEPSDKPADSGAETATKGFFTASDLTERHNVPKDKVAALRKRLERWRKKQTLGTDWIEADAQSRNEDRYLYRESAVLHLIRTA